MNYQERNLAVLAEVKEKLRFERGVVIGRSVSSGDDTIKTTFTAVGSFPSDALGLELFVGLKVDDDPEYRFVTDLRVMRTLADRYPCLLRMLPTFVGLAQDQSGNLRGVLTEDFSQGGRFPVRTVDPFYAELPIYLHSLFNVKDRVDISEFAKMFFEVNGVLKLGDMDSILFPILSADRTKRFPCIDIENNLDRYIIKLDI